MEPTRLALAAAPIAVPAPPTPLLGSSPAIAAIRRTIAQVANTNLTVLLLGESGTGKEVAARLVAAHSGREASMVKINCAAIPQELWESELFGYEAGAFTGANRPKSGKFELAGGGTMFLDEISEMPLPQQAKLLQVLQDGEFSRLGGQRSRSVDVRVIAATNVDLQAAVHAGAFRRDLFYRLNVIAIHMPPLRQRRGDIALLTDFFLDKYTRLYRVPAPPLSPALQRRFEQHAWPGNIRELENLIKRYVILATEDAVLAELLAAAPPVPETASTPVEPPVAEPAPPRISLVEIGRRAAWQAERQAILQTLAATRWNRRLAARQLGISYKGLQNKLRTLLAEG
ncbi:MAG TPA: sigma-54 dependent transcriptional regulator [Terriglobales bacterium]|nr:sigma-54 dependent transcriptional regulator [Terriglobales bacterium]